MSFDQREGTPSSKRDGEFLFSMVSLGGIKGLSSWTQLCWDICRRCESLKFKLMLKFRQSFLTATFLGLKDSILRG